MEFGEAVSWLLDQTGLLVVLRLVTLAPGWLISVQQVWHALEDQPSWC